MSTSRPPEHQPAILCVDDDTLNLRIVETIVRRQGYRVVTARSVPEARTAHAKHGLLFFEGVVTDYSMPGENGLDLVRWIREVEPALSVLLVTAAGDGEVVRSSLREGVVDFLDKPVKVDPLGVALRKAIALTRQRREEQARANAVRNLGDVHAQMLELSGVGRHPRCRVFFRALHETGGDFVTHHGTTGSAETLLIADVSGHDLKDAYLGAVFQGMLRGFVEPRTTVEEVFGRLHRFLLEEWNPAARRRGDSRGTASVALCGIQLNPEAGTFQLRNSGQPSARLTRGTWTETLGTGAPPLGWFDELESDDYSGPLEDGASVLVWTDGLDDLSERLGVDPFAAAFRLRPPPGVETLPVPATEFTDDVLALRFDVGRTPSAGDAWFPIIVHEGHGGELVAVDTLQERWQRSLAFSGANLSEASTFDLLVCAREAARNAMEHGCDGAEDRPWHLQIHVNPARRQIRLSVFDSGGGWSGSAYLDQPRDAEVDGDDERHAGLILLRRLPSQIVVSESGSRLSLNFEADRSMTSAG
jgi:FixJ family two-component response regulator/anti-sigma regulatory factor (Ser/Thr protein kinase)